MRVPTGVVTTRRTWESIERNVYADVIYGYDHQGRLLTTKDPVGTISRNTYDVIDRAVRVEIGTDASSSSSNMVTLTDYYFDSDGAATQGMGNGHLTLTRSYVGEGSPGYRDTVVSFDWRGRCTWVQTPDNVYSYTTYDNLDRPVEKAVFGGTSGAPTSISSPLANRGSYSHLFYSQRGTLYKEQVVVEPTQSSPALLETNWWYDGMRQPVEVWPPSSPATKTKYDALGRVVKLYTTDRGSDAAPGAFGTLSNASSVSQDNVLEQKEFVYDTDANRWAGQLLLTRTLKRHHKATASAGELTPSTAVTTYNAFYYDKANRRIREVNFGTNTTDNVLELGGSDPTWPPTSAPSRTDLTNAIVRETAYDEHGHAYKTVDPAGRVTIAMFDDANRRYAVIENYVNAVVEWSTNRWAVTSGLATAEPDTDRVTSFLFDHAGRVVKQYAHSPTNTNQEKVQITEYVYGVTAGSASTDMASLVASNGPLAEIHYPQESGTNAGQPGTTSEFKVLYAYNRQGESRGMTDQNQTLHTHGRDSAGRLDSDVAKTLGTNVDGHIRRIGTSYDAFGRTDAVQSYTDTSGTTVANAVRLRYTGLGQIRRVYQDHNGVVTTASSDPDGDPTGDTRVVTYSYTTEAYNSTAAVVNFNRLSSIVYPAGATVSYGYYHSGDSSGVDNHISRLVSISGSFLSGSDIVNYQHLGLGVPIGVDYAAADLQLDRTLNPPGQSVGTRNIAGHSGPNGVYPGFDRFGRVISQAWLDGSLTTHSTNTAIPNQPPLFHETYTYSAASERLTRTDARPGVGLVSKDRQYAYDGLHRLQEAQRGAAGTSWTRAARSQKWALGMLNNWDGVSVDENNNGSYTDTADTRETRSHDEANQLTQRVPNTGLSGLDSTYDADGNLRTAGITTALSNLYVHDAWNRLVARGYSGDVIPTGGSEYEYNGLHWRTVARRLPNFLTYPGNHGDGQLRLLYYSASWQLLEERIDEDYTGSAGTNMIAQEVYGARGLDDAVMRRLYEPGTTDTDRLYYHITDTAFSTRMMVGTGSHPAVLECVDYDPYGQASHRWPADFTDDRFVDGNDWTLMKPVSGLSIASYQSGYDSRFDMNRDGTIDSADATIFETWRGKTPVGLGLISDAAGPDNPLGFDGYIFSPEASLYIARYRWYDPIMGRWLQRDPSGYAEGANLYSYGSGNPVSLADPTGLGPLDWLRSIRDALFGNGGKSLDDDRRENKAIAEDSSNHVGNLQQGDDIVDKMNGGSCSNAMGLTTSYGADWRNGWNHMLDEAKAACYGDMCQAVSIMVPGLTQIAGEAFPELAESLGALGDVLGFGGSDAGAGVTGAVTRETEAAAETGVKEGTTVYRVWGDKSGPWGKSWTPVNPGTVGNYRSAAGLPNDNTGRFVSQGILNSTDGITTRSSLVIIPGQTGGLPELRILDAASKMTLIRVSGVNPPF